MFDILIFLKDIQKFKEEYAKLLVEGKLTKKSLFDLCIPLRDKYSLSDIQALNIVRGGLSLDELISFIEQQDSKENKVHRFPKDCWGKKCTHFHVWDMSVDDLFCACDLLKEQCDAVDEDYCFLLCPLTEKEEKTT